MAIRAKVLALPDKQRIAVLMHKYQGWIISRLRRFEVERVGDQVIALPGL